VVWGEATGLSREPYIPRYFALANKEGQIPVWAPARLGIQLPSLAVCAGSEVIAAVVMGSQCLMSLLVISPLALACLFLGARADKQENLEASPWAGQAAPGHLSVSVLQFFKVL
jgi:hypothetical protein